MRHRSGLPATRPGRTLELEVRGRISRTAHGLGFFELMPPGRPPHPSPSPIRVPASTGKPRPADSAPPCNSLFASCAPSCPVLALLRATHFRKSDDEASRYCSDGRRASAGRPPRLRLRCRTPPAAAAARLSPDGRQRRCRVRPATAGGRRGRRAADARPGDCGEHPAVHRELLTIALAPLHARSSPPRCPHPPLSSPLPHKPRRSLSISGGAFLPSSLSSPSPSSAPSLAPPPPTPPRAPTAPAASPAPPGAVTASHLRAV